MLSTILHAFTAFVAAHPGAVAWLTATGLAVYRSRTPEQWIALGESNPRLQGLFKMSRGAGFEPARVLEGAAQVATGRRIPDPRELVISDQARRIAELEASLAAYQRAAAARPSTSLVVTLGDEVALGRSTGTPPEPIAPFDPTLTQDLTEASRAVQRATAERPANDPERGATSLSAAIATVALLGIAGAVGAMVWGCDPTRRFVLDHTDGVPARVSCVPRTQRCSVTDAGVYLPVQCSDDHREWPAMPLRPDGTQRTCAAGEGCEVIGGGIARCIAADAGR